MQAGKASSDIIHIYAVVFYSDSQIDTAASTGKPCLVVILEISKTSRPINIKSDDQLTTHN